METILKITNLNKIFNRKLHAVKNVSFEIKKGNVYGILGPNGSGKSTTLGIVLNVVNKTSGEFEWFEGKTSTHDALKKVGAIIERPNFYPYMSAKENLELVCKIKGTSFAKVDEKLELVGLLERKNDKFKTFSLGMKQRLAIASALLNDPEILILDEPTNGLDPQGIRQIRDIIRIIASQGTTILLASHLLDEVEKVCSHVVVLQKGVMLYQGSVHNMIENNSFFELKSANIQQLKEVLQNHASVEKLIEEEGRLLVYMKQEIAAQEINSYLFERNIVLEHLVKRKNSLEEQFLELTKN
ncbi:ABC transporter ATP-binding protein [Flavobacterium celericrescens]|uniref:ABC transporter ATP-binding protein n=1 Tax=Flavobacterium celericrescens TaxID=2709780 RepID=A0ABX0IC62_9FLAO|nr:ABC transporter ATP-binding protein [Flavobacterium celericrescens]NHM03898.1 ABC transporter ATP-binding protein [Flavobacterium celericrescens]